MSFMMEYLRGKIEEHMEDPAERERKWEDHLRASKRAAALVKEKMEHPTKNWGFWRSDKWNAKYETNADPAINKLPGRSTPPVL